VAGPHIPLEAIQEESSEEPSDVEKIVHWFVSQGFSLEEFKETDLPVIFSIVDTENWIQEQKEKEQSKSSL